jgi:glutaredoxin 3
MNAVLIYTTPTCGYCSAAKRLLDKKGVAYQEMDVGRDRALREEMMQRSGRRTVPQIFIDAKPVGGYDDIAALDAAGKLDSLLGLD